MCSDAYDADYYAQCLANGPTVDPQCPSSESGSSVVCRGGSWNNNAVYARSAYRNNNTADNRNNNVGFRVVAE